MTKIQKIPGLKHSHSRAQQRLSLVLLTSALSLLLVIPAQAEKVSVSGAAEVIASSSPDNSLETIQSVIQSAKKSIKLSAYMMRSLYITESLVAAAKRGVKVELLLDGWTVARPKIQPVDEQELYNAKLIVKAGGKVTYLASRSGLRDDRRFKYLHAKYFIVDGETVFISSENFANSGFSITKTIGSRGWMISIKNKEFASLYNTIFETDSKRVTQFNDLVEYGDDPLYTLQNTDFVPERKADKGTYLPRRSKKIQANMRLERVVAPNDTLETNRAIFGAIKNAKESIIIQNLSFAPIWGKEGETPETSPSPLAEAVLDAARRGVRVRIMLTPPVFFPSTSEKDKDDDKEEEKNTLASLRLPFDLQQLLSSGFDNFLSPLEGLDDLLADSKKADDKEEKPKKISTKDNKALIRYFDGAARKEKLDLKTSMFFVTEDGIRILHNKGMVVDGKTTLISSVNWVENSLKNNREVGVVVHNPEVAAHYSDLFELDWKYFRNSR